jgi:diguanylate cyclase (GGDEF)-like protein
MINEYISQGFSLLFPRIEKKHAAEFRTGKFGKNNLRILLLSAFLFLEQLFYALWISRQGSGLQKVYYISALIMALFACASLFFARKKPSRITFLHELFETGFGFTGMIIACLRFIVFEFDPTMFRIPAVYIAVLYGTAVIYVLSLWQGLALYIITGLSAIILMPFFHPEIASSSYIPDICSNSIIALMVSELNYRNFRINFINRKMIENQKNDLQVKNREIQEMNLELREKSERDDLTGLFNRRKLNNSLNGIFKSVERYGQNFSIILLDIDHFKNINDSLGHDAGDTVLIEMADILKSNTRDIDICGRWGGEEFLIICPGIDAPGAFHAAERLRVLISACSFSRGLRISASFGVASYPEGRHPDIICMLKSADTNLYTAKEKGRNMVVS